jgi:hypothetical protein
MMTKKDYIRAAAITRTYYQQAGSNARMLGGADNVRDAFISLFQSDNPRFDVERFRTACEPETVKKTG